MKNLLFLLFPIILWGMEFHTGEEIPREGTIVLTIPCLYTLPNTDFYFHLTKFADSEDKRMFISQGYWEMNKESLLDLFDGEIPFKFTP